MTKKGLVYWDACVFLSWLKQKEEPENTKKCIGTIEAAKKDEIIIVTSAITLTEVVKIKRDKPLSKEDEEKIKILFESKFVSVVGLDRRIAEYARNLIWQYPHLNPKDSIHLATALKNNIPVLHSFDSHLLKLNEIIENIQITEPNIDLNIQQPLVLETKN